MDKLNLKKQWAFCTDAGVKSKAYLSKQECAKQCLNDNNCQSISVGVKSYIELCYFHTKIAQGTLGYPGFYCYTKKQGIFLIFICCAFFFCVCLCGFILYTQPSDW